MRQRISGSHTAAATIMGKTWLMNMNPQAIKATAATTAPARLTCSVRTNR